MSESKRFKTLRKLVEGMLRYHRYHEDDDDLTSEIDTLMEKFEKRHGAVTTLRAENNLFDLEMEHGADIFRFVMEYAFDDAPDGGLTMTTDEGDGELCIPISNELATFHNEIYEWL